MLWVSIYPEREPVKQKPIEDEGAREIQIARSRMRRKKWGIFLKWRHMIKVRMGMEKG